MSAGPIQDDREKIEIFVSARTLKKMDSFSKSDPQVIMYVKNPNNNQWAEFGRTEWIQNNENPNFVKSFQYDYIFEIQQHVMFTIGDVDDNGKKFNPIGSVETTISKLMGSKNQVSSCEILDKNKKAIGNGKLVFRCERVGTNREIAQFKIRCEKLPDVHTFSKSSPFLQFIRTREDQQQLKVYQTETIQQNLNPMYQQFEIKLSKLCNGDHYMPVIVQAFDFESSGNHKFLSETKISIDQIVQQKQNKFEMKTKANKNGGWLFVDQCFVREKPEFVDYIVGGTQLNLVAAVDFTGSNGIPSQPSSLHYMGQQLNQYQQALVSVGEILINYDYDRQVPVYGFGGKPKLPHFMSNQTSHCFPINGYPEQPQLYGIEGVMQAYATILRQVELSGPTLFNPIITEAMKVAAMNKQNNTGIYTILLILTDGVIHDMDQTKNSVLQSSNLPLSIIIIGVGNEDFSQMEILDDGLVGRQGGPKKRDLVQFVPFNKFKNNFVQLAAEVLMELPEQLVQYYTSEGIKPNQAQIINLANLQTVSDLNSQKQAQQLVQQPQQQYQQQQQYNPQQQLQQPQQQSNFQQSVNLNQQNQQLYNQQGQQQYNQAQMPMQQQQLQQPQQNQQPNFYQSVNVNQGQQQFNQQNQQGLGQNMQQQYGQQGYQQGQGYSQQQQSGYQQQQPNQQYPQFSQQQGGQFQGGYGQQQ